MPYVYHEHSFQTKNSNTLQTKYTSMIAIEWSRQVKCCRTITLSNAAVVIAFNTAYLGKMHTNKRKSKHINSHIKENKKIIFLQIISGAQHTKDAYQNQFIKGILYIFCILSAFVQWFTFTFTDAMHVKQPQEHGQAIIAMQRSWEKKITNNFLW